ncbi:hypothetical protein MNY66_10790 [Moellerella wisconsensis]|uniref:hypothetical protein n=1 Tax=Moellerella wisconsensis TaxID=158849 RepID=UPI001F4E2286|nr:hypothetical protein [Moellerella wisconsensis]UNH41533.1 hypothetical protein MNY66_10790 [Moellerella wisconsensis]
MSELLGKAINFLSEMLSGMVSNGELSSSQAIFIVSFTILLLAAIWKAKEIITFLKGMKNSKLDEYNNMLKNYPLDEDDKFFLKSNISNIIRYRISGISDSGMQHIVFRLAFQHQELISPRFFKKFRTFLSIENGIMTFNKGLGFRFECFIYGLFSIQYLVLSFLFMALSIYKGGSIEQSQHFILYAMSSLLLILFVNFFKMIPMPKECRLLSHILDTQNNQ